MKGDHCPTRAVAGPAAAQHVVQENVEMGLVFRSSLTWSWLCPGELPIVSKSPSPQCLPSIRRAGHMAFHVNLSHLSPG